MSEITIIITLFNKDKFIEQTINSVLKQQFTDWKLLIIDDASTDDSTKKVELFLPDERIKLIKLKRNLGQTHLLNFALTLIDTPFFIQLDADDWLDEKALLHSYNIMKSNTKLAIVYANNIDYIEDVNGNIVSTRQITHKQFNDRYELLKELWYTLLPRFYRTDAVKDIGGWLAQSDGDMLVEDYQMILRLAGKYDWKWLNETLYYRRIYDTNNKKHTDTLPIRTQYVYDLYNQLLKEWGDEYRARFVKVWGMYVIKDYIPTKKNKRIKNPRFSVPL